MTSQNSDSIAKFYPLSESDIQELIDYADADPQQAGGTAGPGARVMPYGDCSTCATVSWCNAYREYHDDMIQIIETTGCKSFIPRLEDDS